MTIHPVAPQYNRLQVMANLRMLQEIAPYEAPTCNVCNRERDPYRVMDAYDYNPLQVMANLPVGWYHGDDGDVCPECMTATLGQPLNASRSEEQL